MGPMNLKDAVALANQYTGGDQWNLAILRDGHVRACSLAGGVDIECTAADQGVAVDADSLLKMLRTADNPKVTLGKGRKLTISWGKSSYTLQAVPEDREPPWPEIPTDGWVELTEHELQALVMVAGAATKAPEWTIRLHPHWTAGTDGGAVAVAWVVGKFTRAATITPILFKDLAVTAGAIAMDDRRVYLRCGDQIRWAPQIAQPFPDDNVTGMIARARGEASRGVFRFAMAQLDTLAKEAHAAVSTKAQTFRLEAEGDQLTFSGGESNSSYGARHFTGGFEVEPAGGVPLHHAVGLHPDRLAMLAKLFGRYDKGLMSIGSKISPVLVWSGDKVVIEVFCTPGLLE